MATFAVVWTYLEIVRLWSAAIYRRFSSVWQTIRAKFKPYTQSGDKSPHSKDAERRTDSLGTAAEASPTEQGQGTGNQHGDGTRFGNDGGIQPFALD